VWFRVNDAAAPWSAVAPPRLFDIVLEEALPEAVLMQRAVQRLAAILVSHAQLRIDEVTRRRDHLAAELVSGAPRVLQVDYERAEQLLAELRVIRNAPSAAAEVRLREALSLVGGTLTGIELGADVVAARLRPLHPRAPRTRVLLLPTPESRLRLQLQELTATNTDTLRGAEPRCYGTTGVDYFIYALNRFDLRTLFLVAAGYVRMNGFGL